MITLLLLISMVILLILAGIAIIFASPLVFLILLGFIVDGMALAAITSRSRKKRAKKKEGGDP